MKDAWFAIVNPAAGHGRCGKLVAGAVDRLRVAGVPLEIARTAGPGHATTLAREAYHAGYRRFVAVGGDGTSYEIVNGLFPDALADAPPALGFLPLGTGNSFLRDFAPRGALDHAMAALVAGRTRPCDLVRLRHQTGEIYSINLLSLGFVADVCVVANRRFKRLGELGYLLGVLVCLARLDRRAFPHRVDGDKEFDRRPCLFLTFNNSKFTGGQMMLAPEADTADGLVELVRWGPIGRVGLVRNLPTLFDGTHIDHPLASRRAAARVEFALDGPIDVMVDGEVLTAQCQTIEALPSVLRVAV